MVLFLQLLPKNCAAQIAQSVNRKKNKDKRNRIIQEPEKPGSESFRKHREEFTRFVRTRRKSSKGRH